MHLYSQASFSATEISEKSHTKQIILDFLKLTILQDFSRTKQFYLDFIH